MKINLTWDLFIIVFFAVIIAYSFIIGKNKTLKLIIATYMSLLASDGLGNMIYTYILGPSPLLKVFNIGNTDQLLILFKVVIFILGIVIISIKGSFEVDTLIEKSSFFRTFSIFIFGFFSAGLIISTVITFTSGNSFLNGGIIGSPTTLAIYNQSELARLMINNFNLWFSLPSLALVFISLLYIPVKE